MVYVVMILRLFTLLVGTGLGLNGILKKLRPKPIIGPELNRQLVKGETVSTAIGKIQIVDLLGEGSYGSVFKAYWIAAKRLVAFKVERPQAVSKCIVGTAPAGYLSIEHEWRMMEGMNRTDGFPLVFTHNFRGKFKYYVMQLLGKTLHSIKSKSPGKVLNSIAVIKYGFQMLQRIEALHARDILMYDIHLGNFLVSPEDKIFVIDLGMAIPFRYDNGRHVMFTKSPVSQKCKNDIYASRHDTQSLAVSRRDDLERLIYVLVDLNTRALPWRGAKSWEEIERKKLGSTPAQICVGDSKWLIPALEYVFSLEFTAKPNYAVIYDHFNVSLNRMR